MSKILQDECFKNLFYAREAMKEWIPMTEYEVIFEATEKSETADKVAKNEAVATKSTSFLKKAIDAVIGLIKRLFDAVAEFINRCTMSGDEREAFKVFKEQMSQDPTMKNKKISVSDFRKINKQYDDLIAEIDQNIRAVKNNADHPIEGLMKKVTDFTKGAVGSATAIVAADVALKMADSNINTAKALKELLRREEGIMEALSKTLGKKDAVKFKKQVEADTKCISLHRLKVSLFKYKYTSMSDAIVGTIRAMTAAGFKGVDEIKQLKKMAKDKYRAGDISKDEYKAQKAKYNDAIKKAKSEAGDTIRLASQVVTNENLSPIVKELTKAAIDAKVDLTKEQITKKAKTWVQDHITDRDHAKRNREGIHKSFINFLTGK